MADRFVFRTNGGKRIGLGHVSRCISLAYALKSKREKAEIVFVVNGEMMDYLSGYPYDVIVSENLDQNDFSILEDLNPDLLIVDSYDAETWYIDSLRKMTKILLFDDNCEHNPIASHFLVNGNLYAESLKYQKLHEDTVFFLGPGYLIMKPEYWDDEPEEYPGDGILITTGGSDFHNLALKFMKALRDLKIPKRIIIGPFYDEKKIKDMEKLSEGFELIYFPKSLKKHIARSKLIISAAGSTVYEILRMKRIPILYTVAGNQLKTAKTLKEMGINYLGNYEDIKWKELKDLIEDEYNRNMSDLTDLFSIFDGKGVFRIMEEMGL